jgi:hypothetical protein
VWFFCLITIVISYIAMLKVEGITQSEGRSKASAWNKSPASIANVIMMMLFLAFSISVFHDYKEFGSHPECNRAARVFFFATIRVSRGWFIGVVAYLAIPSLIMGVLIIVLILLLVRFPGVRGLRDRYIDAMESRQTALVRSMSISIVLPLELTELSQLLNRTLTM